MTDPNQMPTESELRAQSQILNDITDSLSHIYGLNNETISQYNTQHEFIVSINESLGEVVEKGNQLKEEVLETNKLMEKISESSVSFLAGNLLKTMKDDMLESMETVQGTAEEASQGLSKVAKNLHKGFSKRSTEILNAMDDAVDAAEKGAAQQAENSADTAQNAKNMSSSQSKLAECLKALGKWTLGALKWTAKMSVVLVKGLKTALDIAKNMFSSILSSLGGVLKAVTSLPFSIARAGAVIGNNLRSILVEGLGQSLENLKEKFDLSGFIGENIKKMRDAAEDALLKFQDPSSEFVEFFGYGADGMKKYLESYAEMVENIGAFGEVFAGEISRAQKDGLILSKIISAAGYAAEDQKYFAMDAYTSVMSITERMNNAYQATVKVAEQFKINRKLLSKNFMILKKDITLFGHLSDTALNQTAAVMTRMGIEMKEAAAVFGKFSTFEDASNAAAILGQTFGMNLNAMDMIKAEKPEDLFMMFRNAMLDTGRTFDELSRFEKNIMVQQTGMSAEALKAMMNYSAAGLSYEETRKRMEENTPEAKQKKALKELKSSIKEIKKILTEESFFSALTKGLATKMSYHSETRDTLMALSEGYEGLYKYALSINPETIVKLARPIRYIIDTMSKIFESESFKEGVTFLLKGFGQLLSTSFNITDEEKTYEKVKTKLNEIDLEELTPKQRTNILDQIKQLEDELGKQALVVGPQSSYDQYKDAARERNLTLTQYLTNLLSERMELSEDTLRILGQETQQDLSQAGSNVSETLNKTIESQKQNVGILGSLTGKVVRALVIGTMSGLTGIMKAMSNQLDNTDTDKLTGTSLFSMMTGISEKESKQLIDGLTEAVSGLFSKAGKLGGIGLFITKQMYMLMWDVGKYFGEVFFLVVKSIFGGKMDVSDARSASMVEKIIMLQEQQGQKKSDADLMKRANREPGLQGFYEEKMSRQDAFNASDMSGRRSRSIKDRSSTSSLRMSASIDDDDYKNLFVQLIRLKKKKEETSSGLLSEALKGLDARKEIKAVIAARDNTGDNQMTIARANQILKLYEEEISNPLKQQQLQQQFSNFLPNMTGFLGDRFALNSRSAKDVLTAMQGFDYSGAAELPQGTAVAQLTNAAKESAREVTASSASLDSVSIDTAEITKANNNDDVERAARDAGERLGALSERAKNPIKTEFDVLLPMKELMDNLASSGLVRVLSDPRHQSWRLNLEDQKHPTGQIGSFSPPKTSMG